MKIVISDKKAICEWVQARTRLTHDGTYEAIGLATEDGRLVAGVVYEGYNGVSVHMHVAAEGKNWLNRKFLLVCFHYPFIVLGCSKLVGLVPSANEKARHFDERLGFRVEAVVKDYYPDGDLLIYTMTRDQCRWLEMKVPRDGEEVRSRPA